MPCPIEYEELMSLRLDGLSDTDDDQRLDHHIQDCADCSLLWAAMSKVNDILVASALEPLPVPATLYSRVMTQIAVSAPATAPVVELDPLFQPGIGMVAGTPMGSTISTTHTRRLIESPTAYLAGYSEWQRRIAQYVRGIAAAGLAVAGTLGLLLALAMSGTIKLSGPAADAMGVVRTFFQAVDTWVRSVFVNFGPGLAAVGALMVGILILVGWQVFSGYQRSALENRGNTGVLEAIA